MNSENCQPQVIMDTADLSEDPDGYTREHMEATEQPTGEKIEFHVQMKSWTLNDMEDLIVQAAAMQLLGRRSDSGLAKRIEERCLAMLSEKIDRALEPVTRDILDQPISSPGAKEPVTMREFIGLCGREFLQQSVDSDGKPSRDRYGAKPRMQRLTERLLFNRFEREIEKTTNTAILEVQAALKAKQDEILKAETARVREAIGKLTAA